MRRVLLLCCLCLLPGVVRAQATDSIPAPEEQIQKSVVRVLWSRDLMAGGEYFHFAVNGTVIPNVMPRFQATYETDAWVFDDTGHVVAYLGPAAGWIARGPLELSLKTVGGEMMPAKLVGIDEVHGLAVVETESVMPQPASAPMKIEFKPYSGFYIASLDVRLNVQKCTLLTAKRQRGLEEHKLRFTRVRSGRMGNLVFTREGGFAGFLTTSPKRMSSDQGSSVNLMPVEEIVPSVQKILRTRSSIKSGWLGLFLKDQSLSERGSLPHTGISVRKLVAGGPAAKAGLQESDVILSVNDVPAESLSQVVRMIQKSAMGSAVKLDVMRGDKTLQISPLVAVREEVESAPSYVVDVRRRENGRLHVARADATGLMRSRNAVFLGIYTSDKGKSRRADGVVIADVTEHTPAAQAGLKKGDVIVQVNDTVIQNMDQYIAVLMKNLEAPSLVFRALRNDKEIEKTLSLR